MYVFPKYSGAERDMRSFYGAIKAVMDFTWLRAEGVFYGEWETADWNCILLLSLDLYDSPEDNQMLMTWHEVEINVSSEDAWYVVLTG